MLGAMALLVACSEGQERAGAVVAVVTPGQLAPGLDAPEHAASEQEQPAATEQEQPAATEPGEPAPAPAAPEPVDGGLSGTDWVVLGLLGIAAVALIGSAISAAGRYWASKAARRNAVSARLSDIVGSCRWIQDSGTMELLLIQHPLQIQSAWAPVRTQMMDTESQISILRTNIEDDDRRELLDGLGLNLTALRSATEAYVTITSRAGSESSELVQSANQSVMDWRRELQISIELVASHVSYR